MEEQEKKGRNFEEISQEMMPFLIYTAVPIIITIAIAIFFGTTKQ